MAGKMKNILNSCKKYWSGLDKDKKRRIILLVILVAISSTIAAAFLNMTEYEILYMDMDLKECGEITDVLNSLGIESKVSGNTVMVDKRQADKARMQLAMQGYPKTGLNYDLYKSSVGLTTSNKDRKVILQYQLQERLGAVISTLSGIKGAIVTISMPDEDIFRFRNETVPVSACVVLEPERGFEPETGQINAIKQLMITSIAGLTVENLAVIDTNLRDLTSRGGSGFDGAASDRISMEKNIEEELRQKIQHMFEPVFGINNIKTSVKVTMDFDRKSSEIIQYSTPGNDAGIPYMVDEFREKVSDSTSTPGREEENNFINTDSFTERVQSVISYRVNELRQSVQEAEGRITDISVSILINKTDMDPGALEDLKRIASAAVGVDPSKIVLGVMNFTAAESLKEQFDNLPDQSIVDNKLLSENTIVALSLALLTFIFAVLLLFTFKPKKVPPVQNPRETILDVEVSDVEQSAVLDLINKNSKEKRIVEELEKLVTANPKEIAALLCYWIDNPE